jgi:hypothetical protein
MLNFRRRCDQIYTRETAIRRTLTLRCWTGGCTGTVLPRSSEPSGHEPMRLSAEICQPERELKTKTQKEGSWLLARIGKGATTGKKYWDRIGSTRHAIISVTIQLLDSFHSVRIYAYAACISSLPYLLHCHDSAHSYCIHL